MEREQELQMESTREALWYKDAVIYELHVRAFYDSDGDGIGDFRGLTARLDYLQDLGVTALWLLPFYPSPLRDDGYDIADYTSVHPNYGTLRDFKAFLAEAHRRGLKVITELVLNHTSDQHPWFQRARRAPAGSRWRNFYVWSDTPERYEDARIIFQDFESSNWSWDPVAEAYYWHRFYSHQPDLNYDNPEVRKAILKVVDFWLDLGVDGLRLDAVPYLFEREGTTGENLLQTHAALRRLRRHIDQNHPNRMLLAEANQWPEQAAAYFGDGDECHMAFHFPLMPRLFMALRMEDRFPIIDILEQTPPIPETAQWALFLRNHDELTLEMVTEEERAFMYRSYARDSAARINLGIRRRLAPLLHNDRRRIELLNALLFALPGTPVLYYGDEIGMGDNVYLGDRNGVRTPMQWSADRNAGFSAANPQQLFLPLITDHEYHHETVHVEAQEENPHSLLHWMRRMIALRQSYQVFGRGSIEFLQLSNRKVLAFVRHHEGEHMLVVANLSRFLQHAELDLSEFRGRMPVDLFGHSAFPIIGDLPYLLTIGPHSCYWFALAPSTADAAVAGPAGAPVIETALPWAELVRGEGQSLLEERALPAYMGAAPWYNGGSRSILGTSIQDTIEVPTRDGPAVIALVQMHCAEGESQTYTMPLAYATGRAATRLRDEHPEALVAQLRAPGAKEPEAVIYDALWSPAFATAVLDTITRRRQLKGKAGTVHVQAGPDYKRLREAKPAALRDTGALEGGRNNTSLAFGEELMLKLFRCVDEGPNPEVTIGNALAAHGFAHTPPAIAALEYRPADGEPIHLAMLQGFVPNQGEAWDTMQKHIRAYAKRADAQTDPAPSDVAALLARAAAPPSADEKKQLGTAHAQLELIGTRTAEMHAALAASDDSEFAPLPFTGLYLRSIYQSLRGLAGNLDYQLRLALPTLPDAECELAQTLLGALPAEKERLHTLADLTPSGVRIRCHGDYHLAQLLDTGDDFVIFDFEGDGARPLPERMLKGPALRDVAGMLQSLCFAACAALPASDEDRAEERFAVARGWYSHAAAAFLRGYIGTAGSATFLPDTRESQAVMLDALLVEQAISRLLRRLGSAGEDVGAALQQCGMLLGLDVAAAYAPVAEEE
jgi:maltose alpha-D-glucosyltransferase/alpha-amylase